MKKSLILTLGLFFALVGFMSCGNTAEQEAREKAIKDSLFNDSIMKANAEIALADSLRQDSLAQAALAQAVLDSLREDSIMKASGVKKPIVKKKPTPAPAPAPVPAPVKTVWQRRAERQIIHFRVKPNRGWSDDQPRFFLSLCQGSNPHPFILPSGSRQAQFELVFGILAIDSAFSIDQRTSAKASRRCSSQAIGGYWQLCWKTTAVK
jgi:hypothetical protein